MGLRPDGKLYAAPELAVEILSPGSTNERRDRELKLKLYAREGVEEYWLVDWRERTVVVYRRAGAELQAVLTLTNADALTSPLLPGFACPVRDLWEPLDD
jgi:Uma2 family endonuclease